MEKFEVQVISGDSPEEVEIRNTIIAEIEKQFGEIAIIIPGTIKRPKKIKR